MSKTIQSLLVVFLVFLVTGTSYARTARRATGEKTATFVFMSGDDRFLLKGNEAELDSLYSLIDRYRAEITGGKLPVYVNGYCASLPTARENLTTAFIRANRVKSELIVHKRLKEADFVTGNYAHAYHNNLDAVVVTLRIPVKDKPEPAEPVKNEPEWDEEYQEPMEIVSRPKPAVEKEAATAEQKTVTKEPVPGTEAASQTAAPARPYLFALRTNVLYDAFLLPTLGIEWRANGSLGIRLDGSFSRWSGSNGKMQKVWLLNPEARWYLLNDKRFYLGASANYGEYNIYRYPLGNLLKDDTGYQGNLWSAGLTVGYQLPLTRCLAADFNLGLGYTHSEYDSFGMADGVRVIKQRNKSKNFWGPTQAGISLLWTIGGNK